MSGVKLLRPCILVSLKTTTDGNKHYEKTAIEHRHIDDEGKERERWHMLRVVDDPQEHALAVKTRGKVRALITSVCSSSAHGLLCPEGREDELMARIAEARKIAAEFNEKAQLTTMAVNVICGRVAQDDVRAVQAISRELGNLVGAMQDGLTKMNVKEVREAANKAKGLGQMLSEDKKREVEELVQEARKQARKIVKASEDVEFEIDREALAKLGKGRAAFLELDGGDIEVAAPKMHVARALELDDELVTEGV